MTETRDPSHAATGPAAPARLDYLDGWRGLAISLVLVGHFVAGAPGFLGRLGVDVFFVLSGFLMSGLLFVQAQPLRIFYRRRISRILPAFVVFVLAVYALSHLYLREMPVSELVATLLFLRTYFPTEPGIWASGVPIGHLWSLNVEEHSYLLMSLLVLLRWPRAWVGLGLVGLGTACIGIGFLYARMGDAAPRFAELQTEVAAAHLLIAAGYRLWRDRVAAWVPPWLPLLTLAAGVVCYTSLTPWWASRLLAPFLLAFTVNHLAESAQAFRALLTLPWLRAMGVWSFSIYLWQQPFYQFKHGFPGGPVVALAAAMAAGLASFYLLEQPCRNWLNRRWR